MGGDDESMIPDVMSNQDLDLLTESPSPALASRRSREEEPTQRLAREALEYQVKHRRHSLTESMLSLDERVLVGNCGTPLQITGH